MGASHSVTPTILHASCVAVNGQALLIRGKSGSGKSSMALQLIALGAKLVADDRTELRVQGPDLIATCPSAIVGLIEARHIGILLAETALSAKVTTVLDMDIVEAERLPPIREVEILGQSCAHYYNSSNPSFASALIQLLKFGRHA